MRKINISERRDVKKGFKQGKNFIYESLIEKLSVGRQEA